MKPLEEQFLEFTLGIDEKYNGTLIPLLPSSVVSFLPEGITCGFGTGDDCFQNWLDFARYYSSRIFLFDEIQIESESPFLLTQESRNIFGKRKFKVYKSEDIPMNEGHPLGYHVMQDSFYSASPSNISYISNLLPGTAHVRLRFRAIEKTTMTASF